MLYQGAQDSLRKAIAQLAKGNMADKGVCILRAHDIIAQLLSSLDYELGGEVAQNLASLYSYMLNQMMIANVKNDARLLEQVIALLATLKDAWETAVAASRKKVAEGGA
jgi:flagellar protein FliS